MQDKYIRTPQLATIIYICHLGCAYVFVLLFDYCHKVVSRERMSWKLLVVLRCWTASEFSVEFEVLNFMVC